MRRSVTRCVRYGSSYRQTSRSKPTRRSNGLSYRNWLLGTSTGTVGTLSLIGVQQQKRETSTDVESDSKTSQSVFPNLKASLDRLPSLDAWSTRITDRYTDWASTVNSLQELARGVYAELSQGPGSLYRHIVDTDRYDKEIHPEIEWDATVRLSNEIVRDAQLQ